MPLSRFSLSYHDIQAQKEKSKRDADVAAYACTLATLLLVSLLAAGYSIASIKLLGIRP